MGEIEKKYHTHATKEGSGERARGLGDVEWLFWGRVYGVGWAGLVWSGLVWDNDNALSMAQVVQVRN